MFGIAIINCLIKKLNDGISLTDSEMQIIVEYNHALQNPQPVEDWTTSW